MIKCFGILSGLNVQQSLDHAGLAYELVTLGPFSHQALEIVNAVVQTLAVIACQTCKGQGHQALWIEHLGVSANQGGAAQQLFSIRKPANAEHDVGQILHASDRVWRQVAGHLVGVQRLAHIAQLKLGPAHDIIGIAIAWVFVDQGTERIHRMGELARTNQGPCHPELGPRQCLGLDNSSVEHVGFVMFADSEHQLGPNPGGGQPKQIATVVALLTQLSGV